MTEPEQHIPYSEYSDPSAYDFVIRMSNNTTALPLRSTSALWDQGQVLRIKFLNRNHRDGNFLWCINGKRAHLLSFELEQAIKDILHKEVEPFVNLKFVFLPFGSKEHGDIRILFNDRLGTPGNIFNAIGSVRGTSAKSTKGATFHVTRVFGGRLCTGETPQFKSIRHLLAGVRRELGRALGMPYTISMPHTISDAKIDGYEELNRFKRSSFEHEDRLNENVEIHDGMHFSIMCFQIGESTGFPVDDTFDLFDHHILRESYPRTDGGWGPQDGVWTAAELLNEVGYNRSPSISGIPIKTFKTIKAISERDNMWLQARWEGREVKSYSGIRIPAPEPLGKMRRGEMRPALCDDVQKSRLVPIIILLIVLSLIMFIATCIYMQTRQTHEHME